MLLYWQELAGKHSYDMQSFIDFVAINFYSKQAYRLLTLVIITKITSKSVVVHTNLVARQDVTSVQNIMSIRMKWQSYRCQSKAGMNMIV